MFPSLHVGVRPGGKDDAAGSQPISERQNGNRPKRLRGLDMPRDFPHGAMLDGRRKDTKDLSFFSLQEPRSFALAGVCSPSLAPRGCISPASTELEQPAWSKRIWAKSSSGSVRVQSRGSSSGHAKSRSPLGPATTMRRIPGLPLKGLSSVRSLNWVPRLKVQIPPLVARRAFLQLLE